MASRTLQVVITGDASGARNALRDVENASGSLSTRLKDVGASMMRTGAIMTAGITAPLALLGKVAFNAASDLTESLTKVGVVFGENSGVIRKWSQDAATNLGISRQAALEAAGTFGNLFRALGVGIAPATDMSKQLTQLASDLASFNNANPEDVLIALRSGLVGEAEPLRKFGVSLSEARVESKVLELGLQNLDGTISDAAKTQARYAIIMEDTKLAQGDFARTADGAANKQRILKAQFQDTAAALGTSLIPIFLTVAEVVQKVFKVFSNLSPQFQDIAVYAAIAAAALGPIITVIGSIATAVGFLISPVGLVILAIAALIAIGVLVARHFNVSMEDVKKAIGKAKDFIVNEVVPRIKVAFDYLKGQVQNLVAFFSERWNAIKEAAHNVAVVLGVVFLPTILLIKAIWSQIGNIISSAWDYIKGIVQAGVDIVRGIIDIALGILTLDFDRVWNGIKSLVTGVWEAISTAISFYLSLIQIGISVAFSTISGLTSVIWNGIAGAISGAWQWIVGIVSGSVDQVISFITGIPGRIGDVGTALASAIIGPLKAAWNGVAGILNGIRIHIDEKKVLGITVLPALDFDPLPHIPTLAKGGIALGPTLALIGEAGPEAVVPLSKANNPFMGGDMSITIPITLDGRVVTEVVVSNLNRAGGPKILQRAVI